MVDLSIVIVSWNVKNLLRECLDSILANYEQLTVEIFVVDNASGDGTAAMVKLEFPQIKLIENKNNLGFTKANNQGIKLAAGQYIFILNPDTIIKPGALSQLVKFMNEHPQCGAVGPRLLNANTTLQPSCSAFPTLKTQLLTALFLDTFLPKWGHAETKEVDQPMGAAILLRREALDKIGVFDENIFIFYDEVDLCYRLKKAGYRIFFTPEAQVVHYGGQSFAQWKGLRASLRGGYIWRKSRNYFFKKHYGFWQVPILMALDALQLILALGLFYALFKLISSLVM
ncbi:MAG: glycosyltransferase family 2 protein [bacterium]